MSFHSLVHWRSGSPTPPTCPARLKTLCLAMALISAGASGLAIANPALPQGDSVTSGSGSISQSGPDMTVQTATPRTVIDWHSFNVGPNNSISFRQPDGTSVTLNRVLGGDPSKIYGTITSNGQLILVNPAGVWFGPKSRISANALVASAGFVTEEQAKEFARTGKLDIQLKGLVRNEGHITVHDNGMVALLGAQVENAGVIQAKKGTAKLATGPQATLDFQGDGLINLAVDGEPGDKGSVNGDVAGGVHNSGQIDVGNGVIAMSADRAAKHLDSVINIGGDLVADSVSSEGGTIVLGNAATTNVNGNLSAKGTSGGQIKVLGDEVNVAGTAKIDASGTQGAGGKVLVGGSYQGKGPEPASKATTVAKGAQLKADGKTDGGQIVVWSDGKTHFAGSASATGQHKGGEVETSGKQLTVTSDAKVNTRGQQANGTWLLDPAEVNIDATDAGGSVAASTIVNGLANGNVVIRATDTLSVNAPIIATNLATVDNDGRTSPSTLALISAGNAGVISTFDGTDKSNASGAVNIKAPILLKDGNLYISATGDIRLIDNAQSGEAGDAAYGKRAIIDVGSGVAWLKTSDTASIFQDSNTAIIAHQLAVDGASVRLDSALNHAGTLAGKASNGVFSYNQTNASGQAPSLDKAVVAPLTGETLSGVKAYALTNVGTQEIIANGQSYRDIELKPSSGSTFDYVVFEAVDLRDEHGNEIPKADLLRYLDSSDYLVNGLSFKDTAGHSWQFLPDSSKPGLTRVLRDGVEVDAPVGFALNGVGGLAMSGVFLDKAFWGVSGEYIPGASNQFEIQYNAQTGSSQQLIFKLGNSTESVLAQIGWLLDDKPWIQTSDGKPATQAQLNETARIQFLASQDKTDSNVSLNSNKAIISATPQNVQREYGEANPDLNQTLASNVAADVVRGVDRYVDAQLDRSGVIQGTPSTSATQQSNVGDYAINGSLAGDTYAQQRYDLQKNTGTLKVTPAELTVTAKDKSKVYGDSDPALDYSVSGGKLGQTGDQLLNGGDLARQPGENVGNYAISQGELGLNNGLGGNYKLTFADGKLQITPATLVVSADDKQKTYGNADPALSYRVSGLKRGDTQGEVLNNGSLNRDAGENVGRYGIQQGGVDLSSGKGANYILQFNDGVFSIVPAELTVTADGKAKVYGDTDPALSYKVDGLKRGDSAGQVLNDGGLVRQAGEDVGHYGIQQGSLDLNASGGQNYILRYVDGDFVITPATLTVTADGKTKVYGDLDPSLSYQVAGLKNGDLQTDVLNPGKVKRDQGEKVGDYAIRQGDVALAGSKAQNYVLSFVDGTFSITPATLTVSADSHTKVYGDLDPNLTYKVSGLKNGDTQGDVLNPGALQRDQGENVGNYGIHQGTVGLNNGQGSNYVLSFVDGNLAITPATLTITAQDKSKVYGDADPALTHVVSGLKNGETAASVLNGGSLHREAGENLKPGGYAIGQGSLGLNAGAGSNYNMVFKDGTLQITPAPLVVSADDKSKVQGAADPTLSWQVSGLKNGDTADIAKGSLTRAPGEDPGAYGISQGKAFDAGSNYTVTFRDGTLTITGPLVPVEPQPPVDPAPPVTPVTPPATTPPLGLPLGAQSPGNTRCTALESPSAVSANYSVTPAVARTYAVQLICKPRSYGNKTSTTPDITDVLTYANGLFKDGKLILPDWNRSVIPHDLNRDTKGGK
ncbi:filamentous hemagglutinin N-terminal domain-containing protein [Pseudomonas resinovorans]|uniref:Filamentous hemagglutinin N-terminal domain-containing protein n=1 Tax=Metapseudomonas resinovorans TaxID=53412 RepID=A0ABT4Y3F7_METRE|nr:MBG domain-containing protein [Pseudomonas resinovorans]MDA8483379.1 filamentous hemagglutinin N-terminal domain-containing protein [Pseudomonas resinovorans]